MPVPRVFISSTCYDLRYVRENLKFFVRTIGYEPILSEEGAVFYDPSMHVQDACLVEVPACQLFVLIIGGRYGGRYQKTEKSITNTEYEAAVEAKVPIFALVERGAFDEYRVYRSNKGNPSVNREKIAYPAVDSTKIFDFIEQVQARSVNNALVAFSDFEEIQSYLKQQWAGMTYRFLTTEGEARRVGAMLSNLESATEKIEFLTRQVVDSVGDSSTKITVEFYDMLWEFEVIRYLAIWRFRPSPYSILKQETLDEFCGGQIEAYDTPREGHSITHGGPPYRASVLTLKEMRKEYKTVRALLISRLKERSISIEAFLSKP